MPATAALVLLSGCVDPDMGEVPPGDPLVVELKWLPNAADVTWEQAREGLWWALSNLGAAPPDASAIEVHEQGEDVVFRLDLGAAGFPEERLPDVAAALAPVKAWQQGAGEPVDVGRFLLATLYEPGRYYAITGACATLGEWRAARQAPEPTLYAVTVSLLVDGDRLVALNAAKPGGPAGDDTGGGETGGDTGGETGGDTGEPSARAVDEAVAGLGWLASEGEGSLAEGTFVPHEFETVDVMPNGQQRFAVYDAEGALVAAAAESAAGQPGKCMWCHELTVQRGTGANPSAPGYLDYAGFMAEVDAAEAWIAAARAGSAVVDFDTYAVHEWAERLTIAFLEPSPERVAREWGVSVDEVRAEGLATHVHDEFPEMGELYDRADVDAARARREPGWAPLDAAPSDRELDPGRPLVGAGAPACSGGR